MGAVSDQPRRAWVGPFGRWLLLFGAVLGALTVFAALVPAELGVWPRFEPGGMALFLTAGVCAEIPVTESYLKTYNGNKVRDF